MHHLLTLYGLGASPSVIEEQYKHNASYQRPPGQLDLSIVEDMSDPMKFKKYLGKGQYHRDFLIYFQNEIEKKGWENVLNEYFFAGDERADDMLVRLYGGSSSSSPIMTLLEADAFYFLKDISIL